MNALAAVFGIGAAELIVLAIGIAWLVFWIRMIIAAAHEPTQGSRVLWVVIVLLVPIAGALLYWLVRALRPAVQSPAR